MTERQAKYVELTELVLRAAEGDLDAAEHARLEAMLADDAQCRADYADLMMTVCTLDWRAGAETHAARAADSAIGQVLLTGVIDRQREELSRRMLEEEAQLRLRQDEAERRRLLTYSQRTGTPPDPRVVVVPKALVWLGLAAAVALVASVVWLSRPDAASTQATPEVVQNDARPTTGPRDGVELVRVARVAAALDAKWADGRGVEQGASVFDRPIELASGIIELELTSGVVLTIEGPARLVPASDMLVTLDRGKLVSHVPDRAQGFTVRTDTMEVVGQGAEVAIESGGAHGSALHVMAGTVRLMPGRSSQSFEPMVAQAGGAVAVRSGAAPNAIAAEPGAFYRHVPGSYEHQIREAGPLAYWRFNGIDANGEHLDLGASNAPLTGLWEMDLRSGSFPGGESGDRALQLTSRRSIVSESFDAMGLVSGFTVEAWVFVPSDTDRRMRILANNELRSDGAHACGLGFGVSGLPGDALGGPTLLFTGFSVFDATSRTPVPTDQWVHVAVSLDDASQLLMYIDGRLVAHRVHSQSGYDGRLYAPASQGTVMVGNALVSLGGRAEYWVGGIDELAVYGRVLDAQTLAAHAELGQDRD